MIEAQYHTRGRARVRAHSAAGIERRPGGLYFFSSAASIVVA